MILELIIFDYTEFRVKKNNYKKYFYFLTIYDILKIDVLFI